ncbi:MAG: glycine oxidase ThiO [Pyrinomonadaceae bacterium]
MKCDVLIIGGGVIGLSVARELHRRGAGTITIVERGVCGTESSWAAAGMLGPQAETDDFGTFFDLCRQSRDMYAGFAGGLEEETGVGVDLDQTGTLSLAFTDADQERLVERFQLHSDAGFEVEMLSAGEVLRLEPDVAASARMGLNFKGDWQVDNRKVLQALRRYADNNRIEIRENVRVNRLLMNRGVVIGAETDHGRLLTDQTVLATGAWTSLIKMGQADFSFVVEPVRGQAIAFRPTGLRLHHVVYSPRGYVVPRADGRVLAGSTTENVGFDKGLTQDAADALSGMAIEILPGLSGLDVTEHWAGLRPRAPDGLPVLGKIAGLSNLIVATAHYRNGILLAPLTAKVVADTILKTPGEHAVNDFSPDRFVRP